MLAAIWLIILADHLSQSADTHQRPKLAGYCAAVYPMAAGALAAEQPAASGTQTITHTLTIPAAVVPNSVTTNIAVYPTPLANMTEALQRMIQDPNGCFEQT